MMVAVVGLLPTGNLHLKEIILRKVDVEEGVLDY
jgi:hypothetical protein